ncbi:uncharacterized protein LOC132716568 [Ruditapes philippinarum]|uniref:uncharacterized protein LOC132716568 n=1 Tax=Ruditapes philippinarum TaxID=129788 RepID=UPI00295BC8CB|nr:uncharacterized protein LOC132716568 [Ruditapes philippinarum]
MPPDGYKDVASAQETDFNGIISVIINYKDFQLKVHEKLGNKKNIFEQARDIGRTVRHSSELEVEDKDLQQYFKVLQQLLSDPVYLATDTHAQSAKQKIIDLENDILVIGIDDVRKALDDVAKAVRDKIRTEIDEQKKQSEEIKLEMIQRKQDDLRSLESKTAEGVKTLDNLTSEGAKKIKEGSDNAVNVIESSSNTGLSRIKQETNTLIDSFDVKTKNTIEESVKTLRIQSGNERESIAELGKKEKKEMIELGETLQKTLYTRSIDDKEEQYITYRKKLKDELIKWYNTNQSTVPLSPLTDDLDSPLAGFYVMPDIDIHTNIFSQERETTRVKSLEEVFTSSGRVVREIYLSADAGFGKTAFSKYLAITWCQAHQKDQNYKYFKEEELKALSGFEFIFLVLLRDSVQVCNIDDMIEQKIIKCLPCSSSLPKDFLKEILSREKCLVILDGLDEWTHPDNACTRSHENLPHRYARENCAILTTTRPWKLGVSNLRTSQMDRTIELAKLNKKSVMTLQLNAIRVMKKGLCEHEMKKQRKDLNKVIKRSGLNNLKAVPLILMYIVCLWCDGKPIGQSKCQLYTSIVELLLSRTLNKHPELETDTNPSQDDLPQCFIKHVKCQKYSKLITVLGKLAFHTLFNVQKENTLVFNRSIAENYLCPGNLKLSLLSGILTESKVKTYTEQNSKVSFSHKTVQEFFCASYISVQTISDIQKEIVEKCRTVQHILDMSTLFMFISGMKPEIMSSVSHEFMIVINNDEKTKKYRTMTFYFNYDHKPLLVIQDMNISCAKESQENKDHNLCLQDFFINEKCQQENYFKQLQHLCQQNKENIKSIMIENKGICSVQEIINLFTLSDLPHIEKLSYQGDIVEEKIISLLLNPLKCLTVISSKWENHKFVGKRCQLSAEINRGLVKLQHLECLSIEWFTMSHEVMETLLNFLTSKNSMKEIKLYNLDCSDHGTSCRGLNFDLSQHSQLRSLGFIRIPVSQLNTDVSLLEDCDVGALYKPGVVSSYLSQLPAAGKLQRFECCDLESSSDIETMLQTLSLLYHVKDVRLYYINLGERSLTLSPQMINIESVNLLYITMSCSVLHDLISVINKLPHTVTVLIQGCDIKPETEFENFKTFIKQSDNFVVTICGTLKSGVYRFEFKTTTSTE